ncbi:MAG: dTDP-4-keto-6-deoxy-D-glucose epimerase [bacterium]|nr:dTDP-4-keto-6-deoxy-D-glucose epimerase [bacterium]
MEGVVEILAEPHHDERGFFSRIYCPQTFMDAGIKFNSTQINLSGNLRAYTLRGLHFQNAPFAEARLVRCLLGSAYDVVVDIRPDSKTFGQWQAFILSAQSMNAVYIPEGCAHGFLTLKDNTTLHYQMGCPHKPGHASGILWNDPFLAIDWPHKPLIISQADKNWSSFTDLGQRGTID